MVLWQIVAQKQVLLERLRISPFLQWAEHHPPFGAAGSSEKVAGVTNRQNVQLTLLGNRLG